ncbi:acetyl-CoA carboxylase biotin carboxyl carrier protein [Pullulanibacillus sp. KACC 23026]|uniref:acetyl-CoA carboxylase biotin carboxyl carrier protein n=1 Tax=Pullulanibacillus sp. KACC 23026 TaxID=3028315 RepID=UPI0023B1713C|nr:acetyl-CoA carboxylase biotin carboxyl carrier protein [Pullulanibacillus sp. KACC 23026]WEG14314.1 acetyl-CoA carboxylase biotin carboxyl carrier protein [Pullulanibacillus sp. KACC 23026]
MKIEDIREIIKLVDESSIEEFEFEENGAKMLLKKRSTGTGTVQLQAAPAPVVQPQAVTAGQAPSAPVAQQAQQDEVESDKLHKIVSPMVGTFYASSSPDSEPFVKPGTKVSTDTVVCIVEAMKLFNEIEADVKGVIKEVLVENGQLVEYGQPLFLVETE